MSKKLHHLIKIVITLTIFQQIQSIELLNDQDDDNLTNNNNVNNNPIFPIVDPLVFFNKLKQISNEDNNIINKIDLIENGWIELFNESSLTNETDVKYIVRCNRNYNVNSNSNFVRKHVSADHLRWLPVDGYLNKKQPLCARICRFQSTLKNGLVQIDSALKMPRKLKSTSSIELFENGRIKYSCLDGYQLKSSVNTQYEMNKIVYSKKYFIDKCKPGNFITNTVDYDLEYSINENNDENDLKYMNTHECIKTCKSYKISPIKLNGIIVPLREIYKENDRINLMCKEGYAATFMNRTSNLFKFDCSSNGSWVYLYEASNNSSTVIMMEELKEIPICKSLKILMGISNGPDQQDFSETNSFLDVSSADDNFNSNSTNYLFTNSITFENLKLMSIMFIICLIIMSIVVLAVLKYKLNKHQRLTSLLQHHQNQRSAAAAAVAASIVPSTNSTDQFHLTTDNLTTSNHEDFLQLINSNSFMQTPRSMPIPFSFGSVIGNNNNPTTNSNSNQAAANSDTQTLSNSYLPSYEEAIAQTSTQSNNATTTASTNNQNNPLSNLFKFN